MDYGFAIDHLRSAPPNTFAKELFTSADQRLTATVSLLLLDPPNASSMESSRMATEMFLKAYLAITLGLTQSEARQIGHNLEEALNRCLSANPNSDLQAIRSSLIVFPDVRDRYKGIDRPLGILWKAYETAQSVGTSVCRSLTGRDLRPTMRIL